MIGNDMKINPQLPIRANVILTLENIKQGHSLSSLLDDLLTALKDSQKGFAHQLLLGTLRHWHAISRIGESLIKQSPTDIGITCALNMGLYELLYMNTPDYAVINETLNALKALNKNYGVGFINAILRKVADKKAKFTKKIQKNHSLPNWLAKELKQDWGDYYENLGQNLRKSAPIFLRVNGKFSTLDKYADLLNSADIAHEILPLGVADERVIKLTASQKVQSLPHFQDGFVSVQDRHAQLCGHILKTLDLPKNLRLLDACTAPGGKLAQLLELSNDVFHVEHITALDNDEKRLNRVHDNLTRLALADGTKVICADATNYRTDVSFDVIVLDAPCSATGVIRRHPDIALLRTEQDVIQTVALQADILQNLWQNLMVGGYLLYITCSLLKIENEKQILNFLANTPNAKAVDFGLNLPSQIKQTVGYQCLPLSDDDGDGFYYALLQKVDR